MTTLGHKKLNSFTLEIEDPELAKNYANKTSKRFHDRSKTLAFFKMFYAVVLIKQTVYDDINP